MVNNRICIWFVCLLALPLRIRASDDDILQAAEKGDIETVKRLVQQDPKLIAAVDAQGYSPLHKAAYNNRLDVVEYLLAQGADINAVSQSGSTPLHGAASYGIIEIARLLIDKGAIVDKPNAGGYTPLLGASAGGRGDIVRLLAEKGANINASLPDGRTSLSLAVWNSDTALTRFLLEKGARADIRINTGVSLPYFATAMRDRSFGAMFIEKATDVNERDSLGLTMLHYAAARGFVDQVQLLLDKGAEVNAKDSLGRTSLRYASLWGHDHVADLLKARGATAVETPQGWFKGDYLGRPTPGKTPVEFVGDELRTPFAPHGKLVFSPDGKEMLWCHHAMPIQAMWYTQQIDRVWQQPIIAPFTDPALNYADGNPSFSADGKRIYYHSQRPTEAGGAPKEKSDIWFVERMNGGWSKPKPVGAPVNSAESEYEPTVTPSGNLYFIGEGYSDSYGTGDIYVSEYANGAYTTPRNLGPAINSEFNELSPVLPSDESYILFASNRPAAGRRNLQLYVSFKNNGEWTKAVSIGSSFGQGQTWHPCLTPDDKFVIYQQGTKYYWFNTQRTDDIRQAVVGASHVETSVRVPVLRKSEQVFEYAATNNIALGDLDGDGDLDAVFSNMHSFGSRVYLSDGHGQFTATEQLLTQDGHGVDIGDLDADGDLDVVIACNSDRHSSTVYFNDGKANFTASPQDLGDSLPSGTGVQLCDIDADGDLDALIAYYQERNRIYLNDGHGRFTLSGLTFTNGSNWVDLDGDGDVDNFLREDGVGFKSLLNDGTGHFTEVWSKADSSLTRGGVGLGDIDGDGDNDAVVSYLDQSEHRFSVVWFNDGTGRFTESDIRLPLTRYARITMGDLNGDGHIDVFLNNLGLPSAVWLNDGQGRLFDSGIRLPGEWLNAGCALGDIDGDGDLDVLIAAFLGGPNEVWFNDLKNN